MISEGELRLVNDLNQKKMQVHTLIQRMKSPYVKSSIGIVDINSASPREPKPSEYSRFFNNEMSDFMEELNERLMSQLECDLKKIDADIAKYIANNG